MSKPKSDLRNALGMLEPGRTAVIVGNAGTIRALLHKMHGAGSYVVRTGPDGAHKVTLLTGASNAVRVDLGVKAEHVGVRTAAQVMADMLARRKAGNNG